MDHDCRVTIAKYEKVDRCPRARAHLVEDFELAAANAAKQVAQQHEIVDRIAHRAHPAQRGRDELHHVVTQDVLSRGDGYEWMCGWGRWVRGR